MEGPYGSDLADQPKGPLFLYLTKAEWVPTWLEGGVIPLALASSYLSDERRGTKTPDEVSQKRWDGASQDQLSQLIQINGGCRDARIINCSFNGEMIIDTRIDVFQEDAFVLCLSTNFDEKIRDRLEKSACVEIVNFRALLSAIHHACGADVRYGMVRYTQTDERSHFMKGEADSWMSEYRIVIPKRKIEFLSINLPAGIATIVDF